MPGRTKADTSEILSVRVPSFVKDWLWDEGGGGRGSISKALRRLYKFEIWRREGRYVELPREEYDAMRTELTALRGKVRMFKVGKVR